MVSMPAIEAGSLKQSLGSHLGNQVQKFLSARPIAGDLFKVDPVLLLLTQNRDVHGNLWMAIRGVYILY